MHAQSDLWAALAIASAVASHAGATPQPQPYTSPHGLSSWGLRDPGLDLDQPLLWGGIAEERLLVEQPDSAPVTQDRPAAIESVARVTAPAKVCDECGFVGCISNTRIATEPPTVAESVRINVAWGASGIRQPLAHLAMAARAERTASILARAGHAIGKPDFDLQRSSVAAKHLARAQSHWDRARAAAQLDLDAWRDLAPVRAASALSARFRDVLEELVVGAETRPTVEFAAAEPAPTSKRGAEASNATPAVPTQIDAGSILAWLDELGADCWEGANAEPQSIAAE